MKLVIALALSLASLAVADQKPAPSPAKKDCPLCKFPGRAALFAGAARACPVDCAKLCCTGTEATFLIEGLVCDRCSNEVAAALTKLDGVKVESVSHKSGQAILKYDPAKVTPAKLVATIVASGYKFTGQKVSFKIPGLIDDPSAEAVETALTATKGVTRIETVCSKSGAAVVTFDPAQTTRDKLAAAINSTKFKVAAGG